MGLDRRWTWTWDWSVPFHDSITFGNFLLGESFQGWPAQTIEQQLEPVLTRTGLLGFSGGGTVDSLAGDETAAEAFWGTELGAEGVAGSFWTCLTSVGSAFFTSSGSFALLSWVGVLI